MSTTSLVLWGLALFGGMLAIAAGESSIAVSITGKPFRPRLFLINCGFFIIVVSSKMWLAAKMTHAAYAIFSMAFLALHYGCAIRFGTGIRGLPVIWWTLLHIGQVVLTEGMLALMILFSSALNLPLETLIWLPTDGWLVPASGGIILNGILSMTNMFLVAFAIRAVRRMWQRRGGAQPRVALIILREVLLAVSFIGIYAYLAGQAVTSQDGSSAGFARYLTEYSAVVLLCMPVLCVIASYIIQDVQYLRQRRLNSLYEYQRNAYEAVLGNQRRFRHNILNMLYGFEGTILSDDTGEIRRYYEQLIEKCALVNNDNVLALRRVTQPALNGLLLRVLDRARERSIPLQLHVEEGLNPCRRINAIDLCQIVGVLADNALEAAEKAEIRYVGISLSALAGGGMELLVRNTYAGEVHIEQLRREDSAPNGERGHGLPSCHAILRKNKNVFLNFHVSGQYVEAQLLL